MRDEALGRFLRDEKKSKFRNMPNSTNSYIDIVHIVDNLYQDPHDNIPALKGKRISKEYYDNFMEFLGMSGRGIGTTSAPLKTPDPIPVKTSLPNTTAKKPSAFAEAFDADTIRNVINTGLNIWATRSGTTAATTNDLQSGRDSLNLQPQNESTRGIGTTGIVLISVGAIAAVGVLIYYLSKNK